MANQKPSSSTSPQIHFKKTHVTSSSSSMSSPRGSIASPSNSGKTRKQLSAGKGQQTWSLDTSFLTDDGFQWRKYGQKIMLNEKYQKNYFRCSYKYDQGCQASKQVQRIQEDPPIYRTTYIGHHTCKNPHIAQQTITTDSSNSMGSFNLVNTCGDPIQSESYIATANSKISGEKNQHPLTSSCQKEESMEEGSVIGKTYTAASPDSDMGKDLTLCISSDSITSCGSAASPSNFGSGGKDSGETRKQLSARRSQQTWSTDSSFLTEDGFQWRKYGQKIILNEKYPKNYFRCSYKCDEGCQAAKQVQRIQEDPPIYRTTCIGHHTCRNSHVAQQIITADSSNSMGSFNLVNTRGDPMQSKSCIASANSKICGDQNQRPLTSSYQQEEEGSTYNAASPDSDMGMDLTLCISSDSVMHPSSTSLTSCPDSPPPPDFDADFGWSSFEV